MSDTFQMIQVDLAPDSDAHSRDRLTLHAKEPSVSLREALQAQITKHLCVSFLWRVFMPSHLRAVGKWSAPPCQQHAALPCWRLCWR